MNRGTGNLGANRGRKVVAAAAGEWDFSRKAAWNQQDATFCKWHNCCFIDGRRAAFRQGPKTHFQRESDDDGESRSDSNLRKSAGG
jgi:hypothetical protein